MFNTYNSGRFLLYEKNITLQYMKQPPIIYPHFTDEQKSWVILDLASRIQEKSKTQKAFWRLFGNQLPHDTIRRITHFNSRALILDYKKQVFQLFSWDPRFYYEDKDFPEIYLLHYTDTWKDWALLDRWEKSANEPNPHHIVPQSRGGTNSPKNIRQMDRKVHDDFHLLFQNLTPIEQTKCLLTHFQPLLNTDFSAAVLDILERQDIEKMSYISQVMKKG